MYLDEYIYIFETEAQVLIIDPSLVTVPNISDNFPDLILKKFHE